MAHTQPILDAMAAGRCAQAEALCRNGLTQGDNALLRYLLGLALHGQGKGEAALVALRRAAELEPVQADIRYALGVLLIERGDKAAAAAEWRRAVDAQADHEGARYNLARALTDLGAEAEAAEHYAALLASHPQRTDARYNLANLHCRLGAFGLAVTMHAQVTRQQPDFAPAWVNLGMAEQALGNFAAAKVAYDRAIALSPDDVDGHWNLALLLLEQRRWPEGLAQFEWRLGLPGVPQPDWRLPRWTGAEPAGTRVLVWNDHGVGDALHFARYLHLLAARGHRPILVVQDALAGLMATLPGVKGAVGFSAPVPAADVHLPLLSLPYALALGDPEAHWPGPYVPAAVGQRSPGFAVGLVWAGNPAHGNDARRSLDPALLAPLLACPQVEWVSLQVGGAAQACHYPPLVDKVSDLSAALTDYSATAAAIARLDLVISVDTSVAHLAGAMGKEVWLLLPAIGLDWRWPRQGEHTPLYPSMRLFRQPADGDWPTVIAAVSTALDQRLAG